MNKINTYKGLLCAALLGTIAAANAQIKATAFGPHTLAGGTTYTSSNFYKDYVGERLEVTGPTGASIIGDKQYTTSNDGSGATSNWDGFPTAPIVNVPIVMAPGTDSIVSGTLIVNSMLGKIAFIYRGTSEFGYKANQAGIAGAKACVIVNNVPGGPIGMAAGTYGPALGALGAIPVFMISKEDGDAIDAVYRAGGVVTMTITTWGIGNTHDLGFVPGGTSIWHDYAIPADQLASGTPDAYKAVDGAFIANYGSATMNSVSLASSLSFTPTGGTKTTLHTSTVNLTTFPQTDSIWAMFDTTATATNIYSFTASGNGQFDQTFTISSSVADDYTGDNTKTNSFFTTDSLYSKARYDFANNKPRNNQYSGKSVAEEYIWGNMYYVNVGGAAVSGIQYSLSANSTTADFVLDQGSNNLYVMSWVDANNDGVLQNGELTLVGIGTRQYDISPGSADTSGATLMARGITADLTGKTYSPVILQSGTWYYVAVDVPSGWYLGCDGVLDAYPRTFGKFMSNANQSLEYNNMTFDVTATNSQTVGDITGAPTDNNPVIPYTQTLGIQSVDSFNYSQAKGLIPSIAMIVNKKPGAIIDNAVKEVTKSAINATLSPNPATDHIDVAVNLEKVSATVTYTVIDGLGRFVSKQAHNNVQNDKITISTSQLPAGNYNLVINANGNVAAQKFTVIK